jgi:hypothetical protein
MREESNAPREDPKTNEMKEKERPFRFEIAGGEQDERDDPNVSGAGVFAVKGTAHFCVKSPRLVHHRLPFHNRCVQHTVLKMEHRNFNSVRWQ